MTAFILILAFPLIAGLGYGLVQVVVRATTRRPGMPDRYSMVVYALFLLIPLTAVLLAVVPAAAASEAGLQWPSLFGLPTAVAVGLSVLLGVGVGVVLYRAEVLAGTPRGAASGYPTEVHYLADGHTEAFVQQAQQLPIAVLLGLQLFIVCVEEVLWRGYLIAYAIDGLSLSWALALGISAVAFGINHLYFGLWNVGSKGVLGAVWGGLFLLTGSLLIPVVSHLTYNALALNLKIEWEH